MARMLKWTVVFSVDESWVADGFDLTDERAKEMLAHDLKGAFNSEIHAKVIRYPSARRVAWLQGYTDDSGRAEVEAKREAERL